MQKANEMCDRLINKFAENYMEKLFYFCLKKTGDSNCAQDLTQDIALNILCALNKGIIPVNFSAWVWQIARNRYSVWVDNKHKHNESVTGSDIGDYEIEDDSQNILDEMIHNEQLTLLKRELAFIKSDYRNIVAAYYIENKSVRDIASSFSLSVSTVHQRFHRARIILKEGMSMAREFGKRSYNPEQISFAKNGRDGKKGQPWSIITHLLYKNIFLETYKNPETAEELSLEMGIALPYMEDELEYLVREELLKKSGNKYETNFPIISRDEQRNVYDSNVMIQKPLTDKICDLIDLYMNEDGSKVNVNYVGYDNAKWTLLVRTFDWLMSSFNDQNKKEVDEYHSTYPSRPDDGAWILAGYETIDWDEPSFVGMHTCGFYDEDDKKYYVDFAQFKFYFAGYYDKTPEFLNCKEGYTLWLVCKGRIQEAEQIHIKKMLEYGYLKECDGKIEPNVVIFDRNAEKSYNAELTDKLGSLKNEIFNLIKESPSISRGYIVEQALKDGWLKCDGNTINTIGAYIYI